MDHQENLLAHVHFVVKSKDKFGVRAKTARDDGEISAPF